MNICQEIIIAGFHPVEFGFFCGMLFGGLVAVITFVCLNKFRNKGVTK